MSFLSTKSSRKIFPYETKPEKYVFFICLNRIAIMIFKKWKLGAFFEKFRINFFNSRDDQLLDDDDFLKLPPPLEYDTKNEEISIPLDQVDGIAKEVMWANINIKCLYHMFFPIFRDFFPFWTPIQARALNSHPHLQRW